jgi:ADP-ribose pyrophosphatase YjhB (NUDIX family)
VLAWESANRIYAGMTDSFLAASVAIVRRDDLLLVQRNRPPAEGLWTLPGGRLEPGETPEQGAIREVREELGLALYALRPLIVLRHGAYLLQTFATQAFDGEVEPDAAEIRDWRWVRSIQIARLPTTPGLDGVVEAAFRIFDRT